MKRLLAVLGTLAILSTVLIQPARGQLIVGPVNVNAVDASGNCTTTGGAAQFALGSIPIVEPILLVEGTFTGTLAFLQSRDGTNYETATVLTLLAGTVATGTTAVGSWSSLPKRLARFCVRATAWMSGTAAIRIVEAPATRLNFSGPYFDRPIALHDFSITLAGGVGFPAQGVTALRLSISPQVGSDMPDGAQLFGLATGAVLTQPDTVTALAGHISSTTVLAGTVSNTAAAAIYQYANVATVANLYGVQINNLGGTGTTKTRAIISNDHPAELAGAQGGIMIGATPTTYLGHSVFSSGVAFANLGTPDNGSWVYCTDCLANSNPCSGASSGAFAKRLNGTWDCR